VHLPTLTLPAGAFSRSEWERPLPERSDSSQPFVPHVVAWNLTRRCNLACAHCYISAGSWHAAAGELDTGECLRVLDEILDVNSTPMLILSGGEPLLRSDLETIAERGASRGATVVVGTNGTRLTESRIRSLTDAGVQGVAVSIDSLDPRYHDRFRHAARRTAEAGTQAPGLALGNAEGGAPGSASDAFHTDQASALEDTLSAVERLRSHRLDFVIQTTVTRANRGEVGRIAAWAAEQGAVSFNLYFLVATGRAEGMAGLTPQENDQVLEELVELERTYRGRMMVRSKCQPQLMRHIVEGVGDSPLLNYATRCPCGVQYCRITPEGKLTPCPYSPVVAGDLRTTSFREIWEGAPVFGALRHGELGGRCGRCEYRKVCGGCRARAQAELGDLLAEDPACGYEPSGDRPVVEPRTPVSYGSASPRTLEWSADARARLERIPSFVRGVVSERVERFARERGYAAVDLNVMAEVRRQMPVDFSKRLPFFLGKEGNS
jgi:radical SAM protein with 4Fe4S-binding SPASM domain